ncbi:MAG: VPLPA-CTERM-specific exosortase XrtD [Pseudomonadota bacterium]
MVSISNDATLASGPPVPPASSGDGLPLMSTLAWVTLGVLLAALGLIFFDGLAFMVDEWSREEYSHGYLIPIIAAAMVWRERRALSSLAWSGSYLGLLVTFAGLGLFLLGELSTLYVLIQYAFLLTLTGVCLAIFGVRAMRYLWVPLVYLFFMIPLPNFLYANLSQQLQLISSALGVAVIRLFDISVFLEGNVIDLGVYQLQVVEACSGLRYLFPLMSFGFLCAYLFKAPAWQRVLVFLSSIPLTVLMNSIRVGIIGVLVEYFGIEQAEGFLHYFEGWVIFMACVGMLFAGMWLLARFTGGGRSFNDVFVVDLGEPAERGLDHQRLARSATVATVAVVVMAVFTLSLTAREEVVPPRAEFTSFPLRLGDGWVGRSERLRPNILKVLKLTDYALINYTSTSERAPVNLYSAYYASQRKGASIHSPRSCLPGNDWIINDSRVEEVDLRIPGEAPVRVNRVLIQKERSRQLVYYWFDQRGRSLTNEYAVKWYLLWDALRLNRTDGALLRLTTPILESETPEQAEARLQGLLREVSLRFDQYLPD